MPLLAVLAHEASANKALDAAQALRQGKDGQAVEALSAALADATLGNERRAMLYSDRGAARVRLQQFKLALDDFNQAARLYPEYPAVYVNRGNLLLVLGQPQEALRDFDRALLLAPDIAAVHANRGAAQLRAGGVAAALADYNRAVELGPGDPVILSGRGRALIAAGRPHAAIRDFSRATELNSTYGQAYRNRAEARMLVGQFEEAASDLSRALAFDNTRVDDYLNRGEAYLAAGDAGRAITDFTTVTELRPASADGYVGRSFGHALTGAFDDALDDLTKALDVDTKSVAAFAARGYVYIKMQQPALAERDLDRLQKLQPNAADTLWLQGEIEEAYGRGDTAIIAYRKAAAVAPRHRMTQVALKRLGFAQGTEAQEVAGAGLDGWRVLTQGNEYWARNAQFPKLSVLLEMSGAGQPKITGWERKKPPHSGFGTLHYAAGTIGTDAKGAMQENAAIVDVVQANVLGIVVAKLGPQEATFSWGDGILDVAAADGGKERFKLVTRLPEDRDMAAVAAPRRALAPSDGPMAKKSSTGMPTWSPWANSGPSGSGYNPPQREAKPKQKPKTFFDMLFGN
ncbi:MAG TPA: tetratricopeptide repeat protein [Hyphomicrobiaceae bacterium]|nr:tetratricopeptide repeat protein [Hyphomicrobiaceae bacterium]